MTFRQKSADTIIELTAEAGLSGIEWGGDIHVPAGKTKVAEQVRRWTEEAGLAVSAYGSYYKFDDINPQSSESGPEIEAVLDTAEALGTDMIRIGPGSVGSAEATLAWREAVVEQTRRIADLAGGRGLRLGFEFHDNSLTDTVESTVALLDAIGCDNVSTFWQTNRSTDHEAALAGLRQVSSRVSHVHCHHLVGYLNPPFEFFEKGISEWETYLDVLSKSGGKGRWVSIEFVRDGSEEAFRRDAAALIQLLERF